MRTIRNKTRTLEWLFRVPGRKKGYIAILTILQILLGLTGVLYALLLRAIVDHAVGHETDAFRKAVLLIGLLVAGQLVLQSLVRWMNERARAALENGFRRRLTENLLRRDYAHVSAVHSGEWMNRLTSDTIVVTNGYVDILPGFSGTAVRLISSFIMLLVLQPSFTLMILPGALILAVLIILLRPRLKRLHKEMQAKDGTVRSFLQERINSLMVIKCFAAEGQVLKEADELMEEHRRSRMRKNYFSNILNTGFATAMEGVYLFGVCFCAYGILSGAVSYGTLTAVTQLISQIRTPFARLSGFLPTWYAMLASAERLMETEQFPEDQVNEMLSAADAVNFYKQEMQGIGLHHADYSYYPVGSELTDMQKSNMPVVLKDFSLEVRKGETVAFTGQSGCGKSTVLKLLMCIYPLDRGTRYILKTDGTTVPLTERYRRLFAYVPQGNMLMTGTIREIIGFSRQEDTVDEACLRESLRIACADEFVNELKDGTDTLLGERGTGLSEGQMQRIAIARAIYSEAPIILLDEATSALDASTEEKLLVNLRNMTDKTVIIVTHRHAALKICDRVLDFTEDGIREQ